jgi:hypothetical protein
MSNTRLGTRVKSQTPSLVGDRSARDLQSVSNRRRAEQ